MQTPKDFQTGGLASMDAYYNYVQPTQAEMDQQEADYYGITVDELRNFRQ